MRHANVVAVLCLGVAAGACRRDKPGETAAAPAIDTAVAAITGDSVRDTTRVPGDTSVATAAAEIASAQGQPLGSAQLRDSVGGVVVHAQITGLKPGNHGFHVHTVGRCDPPAFESAGPHWNPTNKQHGRQNPAGWHAGDLANLGAAAEGVAQVDQTIEGATIRDLLEGDGSALVVHADPDDNKTDPSGNSGARIACGVIHRVP
ncbi:MAG TPA: superoxide dismutase family protein [Longimicrobium sp.]|jgi:Cu-Zn family superoxide dismutase|nr:superoxide dismutase family protein [Longimicrobium sp.]